MDKKKDYLFLQKTAKALGADLFGVADIRFVKTEFALAPELVARFDRAIVLAVRLSASVLSEIEDHPTKLYFHHYRSVNGLLDQIALRLVNTIQDKGYNALAIPASQILDWQKQTAHLSHKKIAQLAGLGWLGRNNLLVNKKFGSRIRLVTILTDMPLPPDKPSQEGCSSCRACIQACPAGAIREEQAQFDHLKCFEKLKDFQKQKFVEQYICGICVKACSPLKK